MPTLNEERDAVLSSARQIVDGARSAGRDLSGEEVKSLNTLVEKVKSYNERIENSNEGARVLKALFGGGDSQTMHRFDTDDSKGYLDMSPAGIKRLAGRFAERMTAPDLSGRKSLLAACESLISVPMLPADPVLQAQTPLSLLSILPSIKIPAGAAATYIRQTSRESHAAAVAVGDSKPVSLFGLTAVPVRLAVYASLSDPADKYLVDDAPVLATFLANELLYAVSQAVEKDVIDNDPTGVVGNPAGIRGLLKTSGIVIQAFDVDLLTSLRSAKIMAEALGYVDSLIYCLSATDWASAELARASTGGTFDLSTSPVDAAPRRLWGLPVAVVSGLPEKTAILLDRSAVAIYSDAAGMRVEWASPSDQWSKNQITARCEGRYDCAVMQPNAVIKIATAAA